jgi:8-oxo-dGTP diphosphatase
MIEVSAGIVRSGNEILCFQRGPSKYRYLSNKFEFPGGKIEPGETPYEALVREFREELKVDISKNNIQPLCTVEHTYPNFSVRLHAFIIDVNSFDYTLTEHLSSKTITKESIDEIDWADADVLIVNELKKIL